MSAHKVGNRPLDLSHTRTACPARREVGVNLICATIWKFTVGRLQQFLVCDVQAFAQHNSTSGPHGSAVRSIASAIWIRFQVRSRVLRLSPDSEGPPRATAGNFVPRPGGRAPQPADAAAFEQ